MRGRKEVLWALAISAALITAGLVLSCGDDNGDAEAEVSCQDFCEKLDECFESTYPFGETVEDCEDACEEELAGGAKGALVEVFQCVPDTDCWDIFGTCLCQPLCEKLIDCVPEDNGIFLPLPMCVFFCQDEGFPPQLIMCVLGFSSCHYIEEFCMFFEP